MKVKDLFETKEVTIFDTLDQVNKKLLTMGMEKEVWSGDLIFSMTAITTLRGLPRKINGTFSCTINSDLQSIKDGPTHVAQDYFVNSNDLISLSGAPEIINNDFYCYSNFKLTSLKGGPKTVLGHYNCYNCNITSLEGIASNIGGNLHCSMNEITSLQNIHKQIKSIGGGLIDLAENPIASHVLGIFRIEGVNRIKIDHKEVEKILNKNLSRNDRKTAIYDCQEELINAGFEEYAQL